MVVVCCQAVSAIIESCPSESICKEGEEGRCDFAGEEGRRGDSAGGGGVGGVSDCGSPVAAEPTGASSAGSG